MQNGIFGELPIFMFWSIFESKGELFQGERVIEVLQD